MGHPSEVLDGFVFIWFCFATYFFWFGAVVSHISRKTSEMWGTRDLLAGTGGCRGFLPIPFDLLLD
jgi:hypothetical protein